VRDLTPVRVEWESEVFRPGFVRAKQCVLGKRSRLTSLTREADACSPSMRLNIVACLPISISSLRFIGRQSGSGDHDTTQSQAAEVRIRGGWACRSAVLAERGNRTHYSGARTPVASRWRCRGSFRHPRSAGYPEGGDRAGAQAGGCASVAARRNFDRRNRDVPRAAPHSQWPAQCTLAGDIGVSPRVPAG
jgi:hypothetical protein